jgi:CBS domain-containing protein
MSVVWTRGRGCSELADLLSIGEANRISGDVAEECIANRADLLVSRRMPGSFELVNVAVPVDFEPENVTKVVSAVAGGPHSVLAATVAAVLGDQLGVEAEMISASQPGEDRADASGILERIGLTVPGMRGRVVEVEGITELVEDLDEGALLVIGAPGGSWLQRARFGPGARLKSKAHAGAVMVRMAPERVFQRMHDPVFVGPLRHADDTLRIHGERVLAVADEGLLVGLVRREHLVHAGDAVVGTIMEEAVSAKVDETVSEARELESTFGSDPIPVTDHSEHLVGALSLPIG